MNKKYRIWIVMALVLICATIIVSCGGISKDKAVDLALKSIGTSKVYVQKWEVSLDKSQNPAVYVVTAWREGKYVISVNSKTGEIVKTELIPQE